MGSPYWAESKIDSSALHCFETTCVNTSGDMNMAESYASLNVRITPVLRKRLVEEKKRRNVTLRVILEDALRQYWRMEPDLKEEMAYEPIEQRTKTLNTGALIAQAPFSEPQRDPILLLRCLDARLVRLSARILRQIEGNLYKGRTRRSKSLTGVYSPALVRFVESLVLPAARNAELADHLDAKAVAAIGEAQSQIANRMIDIVRRLGESGAFSTCAQYTKLRKSLSSEMQGYLKADILENGPLIYRAKDDPDGIQM
jgi:hypothetical protein